MKFLYSKQAYDVLFENLPEQTFCIRIEKQASASVANTGSTRSTFWKEERFALVLYCRGRRSVKLTRPCSAKSQVCE